jgi:hypothetical protein
MKNKNKVTEVLHIKISKAALDRLRAEADLQQRTVAQLVRLKLGDRP